MQMEFAKMHGCGNDYVYVNCLEKELPNPGEVSRFVSQKHFGICSDGLIGIYPSRVADFKMRIWNADASEAQMCGNGIRCVAKYVYDRHLTDKTQIKIETLGGIKVIDVKVEAGKVVSATVDMGRPEFTCTKIPMISDHYIFVDQSLVINPNYDNALKEKVFFNGTAISMGNPHYVTFVDDVDALDLEELGPKFEHHKLFPEGVNTEFVQVLGPNSVKFRVWERGSAETLACGTGACAVCVAANILRRAGTRGNPLDVYARGGKLRVTYRQDKHVILDGPAVEVFSGVVNVPDEIVNAG